MPPEVARTQPLSVRVSQRQRRRAVSAGGSSSTGWTRCATRPTTTPSSSSRRRRCSPSRRCARCRRRARSAASCRPARVPTPTSSSKGSPRRCTPTRRRRRAVVGRARDHVLRDDGRRQRDAGLVEGIPAARAARAADAGCVRGRAQHRVRRDPRRAHARPVGRRPRQALKVGAPRARATRGTCAARFARRPDVTSIGRRALRRARP